MTMLSDADQTQTPSKMGPPAARSLGRAANWSVGAAAAVLVLMSVGGYFYHREQLSAVAARITIAISAPCETRIFRAV